MDGNLDINIWSFTKKIFFRFFASYFIIFIFPFPARYIPVLNIFNKWYQAFLNALVSLTGKNLFNISFPLAPTTNGSGDTTYNYVRLFLFFVLAIIVTVIWSVADHKRKNYNLLLYWAVFYIRYYLGLTLISYGMEKLVKTQFPFPFYALNETYGESSPMRLLWTFMGYSSVFNVIIGLSEIISGILLLFRKLSTLGALSAIFILGNVVLINFCFDVPVKLFSTNLLLMVVFILLPDLKRLLDFFLRNKAVAAATPEPKFSDNRIQTIWFVIKFTVIVYVTYVNFKHVWAEYSIQGDAAFKRTPLFGIYTVQKFIRNNDTVQSHPIDTAQWKMLNIIFPKQATIETINDSVRLYSFFTDTINKKIRLYIYKDSAYQSILGYSQPDSINLVLNGKLKDDSVYILLQSG